MKNAFNWVTAIICISVLAACAALGDWLGKPATPSPQEDPTHVTVDIGAGTSVTVPTQPTTPVTVEVPGGGSATITPPPPPVQPTRADAIANVGGGVVTAITGNSLFGMLTVSALSQLLMLVGGKKNGGKSPPTLVGGTGKV